MSDTTNLSEKIDTSAPLKNETCNKLPESAVSELWGPSKIKEPSEAEIPDGRASNQKAKCGSGPLDIPPLQQVLDSQNEEREKAICQELSKATRFVGSEIKAAKSFEPCLEIKLDECLDRSAGKPVLDEVTKRLVAILDSQKFGADFHDFGPDLPNQPTFYHNPGMRLRVGTPSGMQELHRAEANQRPANIVGWEIGTLTNALLPPHETFENVERLQDR